MLDHTRTLCLLAFAAVAGADTLIDNEQVRVLKVSDEPRHKSALHQHAINRVMIYLDSGDMRLTYEDGSVDNQHWKAGDVAWSPAGAKHTSENIGEKPIRIVEVELKGRPASPAVGQSPLDPLKIDPKHDKLNFENGQVRVFTGVLGPHESEPMHEHVLNRVVVMLNDQNLKVTTADGKSSVSTQKAGDVIFAGPAKHRGENMGNQPARLVIVELK